MADVFPEFPSASHKFEVVDEYDEEWEEEATRQVPTSFLFIKYEYTQYYVKMRKRHHVLFNIYRKTPSGWIPVDMKWAITSDTTKERAWDGRDDVLKFGHTPSRIEMEIQAKEKARVYAMGMGDLGHQATNANQELQTNGPVVPEISAEEQKFTVDLYAADLTPDDDIEDLELIRNTSVGVGYFSSRIGEILEGRVYSYDQIKSAARGNTLVDAVTGEKLPKGDYQFVFINDKLQFRQTGEPRRSIKPRTVILPYSSIRVLIKKTK